MPIQEIIEKLIEKCTELNKIPKELILTSEDYDALVEYVFSLEEKGFIKGVHVEDLGDGCTVVGWLDSPRKRQTIEMYKNMRVMIGAYTHIKAF